MKKSSEKTPDGKPSSVDEFSADFLVKSWRYSFQSLLCRFLQLNPGAVPSNVSYENLLINARRCSFQRLLHPFYHQILTLLIPTSSPPIYSSTLESFLSDVFSEDFFMDSHRYPFWRLLVWFSIITNLKSLFTDVHSSVHTNSLQCAHWCYPFSYYQLWICLPNSFTILYYRGIYLTIFLIAYYGCVKMTPYSIICNQKMVRENPVIKNCKGVR